MVAKAIVQILDDAQIGGRGNFAGRAPQGQPYPYTRTTAFMQTTRAKQGIGLYEYSVQVDVFGKLYKQVQDIGKQVQTALEGVSGTYAGVEIRDCMFTGTQDGFDDDGDYFQLIVEFNVNTKN